MRIPELIKVVNVYGICGESKWVSWIFINTSLPARKYITDSSTFRHLPFPARHGRHTSVEILHFDSGVKHWHTSDSLCKWVNDFAWGPKSLTFESDGKGVSVHYQQEFVVRAQEISSEALKPLLSPTLWHSSSLRHWHSIYDTRAESPLYSASNWIRSRHATIFESQRI